MALLTPEVKKGSRDTEKSTKECEVITVLPYKVKYTLLCNVLLDPYKDIMKTI